MHCTLKDTKNQPDASTPAQQCWAGPAAATHVTCKHSRWPHARWHRSLLIWNPFLSLYCSTRTRRSPDTTRAPAGRPPLPLLARGCLITRSSSSSLSPPAEPWLLAAAGCDASGWLVAAGLLGWRRMRGMAPRASAADTPRRAGACCACPGSAWLLLSVLLRLPRLPSSTLSVPSMVSLAPPRCPPAASDGCTPAAAARVVAACSSTP